MNSRSFFRWMRPGLNCRTPASTYSGADLPWGQLLGSHEDNLKLYPLVLAEAARVAAPGARAVFITHEIRLMERTLRDFADRWTTQKEVRVFQGGLHPRIYLLARRD